MDESLTNKQQIAISKIKKRDERIVDFDQSKIVQAVFKAAEASRPSNFEMSHRVAHIVFSRLEKTKGGKTFTPEEIRKTTKNVLVEEGHHSTAEKFDLTANDNLTEEELSELIYDIAKKARMENKEMAEKVAGYVVERLENKFNGHTIPSVEDVQNEVEKVLIERGHTRTAKAYILYRQKRTEIRKMKIALGVEDDLKLPINTLVILSSRYLQRDENRRVIETPKQLFTRVARTIAEVDKMYDPNADIDDTANQFFEMMVNFDFLPNSPTLMNAGTEVGQLSACFVVPVEDSIVSIFDAIKTLALIHKSGGGTGFSFSKLRPKGDAVKSTGGVASGPVSFMKIFDSATNEIKQGGKRRGANMGILKVDHPDILDFIVSKEREKTLSNFNISVAMTDKFMDAVINDKDYELINPKNNQVVNKLNARAVWNLIVTMAWKTGDPGVIFIDRINKTFSNPVPSLGPIEATNPCGEQPLYPFDSCNLGSINLARMVNGGEIDWNKLRDTVRKAVHFLDNIIDANKYPILEIELMTKSIRRIGLGVMGFADMLIQLGIPYNSTAALRVAESIMKFITDEARKTSIELAKERGAFPKFKDSIWSKLGYEPLRNATVTTIAPTGTISVIAGCSSGIEPLFSVSYMRNVAESLGENLIETNSLFEKIAIRDRFYSEELMKKISGVWSVQHIEEIPEDVRKIFVTAHDISPEWHVRMQAAFQKYTDNAVSKTINFSVNATPQDVEKAYLLAYQLGCKGITVYRDNSRESQIITTVRTPEEQMRLVEFPIEVSEGYSGGCETCEA